MKKHYIDTTVKVLGKNYLVRFCIDHADLAGVVAKSIEGGNGARSFFKLVAVEEQS